MDPLLTRTRLRRRKASQKGMAMKLLRAIGRGLRRVGRGLLTLVREDAYTDVRGTYPEHYTADQEKSATSGSVTTSLTGLGHG